MQLLCPVIIARPVQYHDLNTVASVHKDVLLRLQSFAYFFINCDQLDLVLYADTAKTHVELSGR